MLHDPIYDPTKSYEENFEQGPFGAFAQGSGNSKGALSDQGEPKYDFFGFKVHSPFGVAAGPLINGKFVQAALDKGFDIVTYKTVRSRKYPCHPWPNVLPVKTSAGKVLGKDTIQAIAQKDYEEPLSITNSFGVPSFDPDFWQKDVREIEKNIKPGQILVGAFQRTKKDGTGVEEYIKDFVLTAKLMKETGVKVMEVNFSCPNEGTSELLCYDVARSVEVLKAIKDEIKGIPLIVKISYFKDEALFEKFIKEVGFIVQGIAAINTIFSEIVDEKGVQVLPGRTHSGVCGSAIKWAGLDMVARMKNLRKKFGYSYTIVGVGGVATVEDFLAYRTAGADIVMSVTGMMWNPYLAKEIKEKLK